MRTLQLNGASLSLSACFTAATFAAAAASQSTPYLAVVRVDRAVVRSGPGQDFYPTAELRTGDTVEVYHEEPGGWLGVRPTPDSFSWVAARYLSLPSDADVSAGTIATVRHDRAPSRVGSQISASRDVVHVWLDEGEQVEILAMVRREGVQWCRIAPPAGEFRWIAESDVAPLPEAGAEASVKSAAPTSFRPAGNAVPAPRRSDLRSAVFERRGQQRAQAVSTQSDGLTEASAPTIPAGSRWQLADLTRPRGRPPATAGWQATQRRRRPARPPTPTTRRSVAELGPDTTAAAAASEAAFRAALEEAEWQVTQLVAEEPSNWRFGGVEAELARLHQLSVTAVHRGHLRRLESRVRQLRQLQAGYRDVATSEVESVPRRVQSRGILRPVVSRRRDTPKYAIVDPGGSVRSFVTPAPGVQLQSYLGREVGLEGKQDFMPELRRPLITAQRVIPLNSPAR